MDNIFIRTAKLLVRNGLITKKAETFILSLLSKSKKGIRNPIIHNKIMQLDSEVVISDLEAHVPDYEELNEYKFILPISISSYHK